MPGKKRQSARKPSQQRLVEPSHVKNRSLCDITIDKSGLVELGHVKNRSYVTVEPGHVMKNRSIYTDLMPSGALNDLMPSGAMNDMMPSGAMNTDMNDMMPSGAKPNHSLPDFIDTMTSGAMTTDMMHSDVLPSDRQIEHVPVKVIRSNFDQANSIFEENAGKQCVANCLSALAYSSIKELCNWRTQDIDDILFAGNELYTFLQRSSTMHNDFLLISELPDKIEIRNRLFHFKYQNPIVSLLNSTEEQMSAFNACTLEDAVQLSFTQSDYSFVTFGGNTFLIGKSGNFFFAFDSHSRSYEGLVDPFGKSTVIVYPNMTSIVQHIRLLARSMDIQNVEQIEMTAVQVNIHEAEEISDSQVSDIQDETSVDCVIVDKCDDVKERDPDHNLTMYDVDLQTSVDFCAGENDDVYVTFQNTDNEMCGRHLTKMDQISMCTKLGVKRFRDNLHHGKEITGRPTRCHRIKRDGNCFFRAISFSVCNHENRHAQFREKICGHALENGDILKSVLRDGDDSTNSYMTRTKMNKSGTWASEVEIFTASHLLKCNIYIFDQQSQKWLLFSPRNIDKESRSEIQGSIFLNHVDKNHYNVVIECENNTIGQFERLQLLQRKTNKKRQAIEMEEFVPSCKKSRLDYLRNYQKERYEKDVEYQEKKKTSAMENYERDQSLKHRKKVASILKYSTNQKHQDSVKAASKVKYSTNTEFQDKKKAQSKMKYATNKTLQDKKKAASILKYANNKSHQDTVKKASILKYANNKSHQDTVKKASISKYANNKSHQDTVKKASILKYATNKKHQDRVKGMSKLKYETNLAFRERVKVFSKLKYATDYKHRQRVKHYSRQKYSSSKDYRQRLKQLKSDRYRNCAFYRKKLLLSQRMKYRRDASYRKYKHDNVTYYYRTNIACNKQKLKDKQVQMQNRRIKYKMAKRNNIISQFKKLTQTGPEFPCVCCQRLLFKNQCQSFKQDKYKMKMQTSLQMDSRFKEGTWICKTCHRKLLKNEMPVEAESNGLKTDPIPHILGRLNSLERHLIAMHLPFMKVTSLPKGGQNCIHGPVVCVPTNLSKTMSLPRNEESSLMLKVKLKRKLSYKGHHEYKFVNPSHVMEALSFLVKRNKWYKHIRTNGSSMQSAELPCDTILPNGELSDIPCDSGKSACSDIENPEEPVEEEMNKDSGVQYDTCLQPADIAQDVLDHSFDEIYNIAPGEGNNPVKLLKNEGNEAKSFPTLFPTGRNTFDEPRHSRITLARYFNNRLMNRDNRFARDSDYIFYSQYVSELNQVLDKTQISLRKSRSNEKETNIQNTDTLRKLLHSDEAYRFMQPIRGTPAYWENAQKDIFAMLRQLGIPTWFCSFSAAEFRWKDIVSTIMQQENDKRSFEDLTWNDKSEILKNNPVTVARMFDKRFHVFLQDVILGPNEPIGKIKDYFYRVEFQQRGSPHVHCLFWVENAPTLDQHGEDAVCEFIDRYVTCSISTNDWDKDLKETVESVQSHSKSHSKSCKKKGTACRFNFPRPPSKKTFLCTKDEEEVTDENKDSAEERSRMTKDDAKKLLAAVWKAIENDKHKSMGQLLRHIGVSQAKYEEAHNALNTKQTVVLQRNVNELWINPYNPTLLQCWDANMDIQFVLDPFSCIVYIISYISKAEREMGLLLKQTKIEAEEGNKSASQTLKAIGSAFLHNREIGIQEAVYRVCTLKMKECSRKVVFVPVGENPVRLSKPLSQIKPNDETENGEQDNWMTNIVDRYYARPETDDFQKMCLGLFCSVFRTLAKSQVPKNVNSNPNVFRLQKEKGFIQRRTRTDEAVIRYYRGNMQRKPEEFYQSLLQLFLPHRSLTQLKPPGFDLYETFYESGYIRFSENADLQRVKQIVEANKSKFVKNEEEIDKAIAMFDEIGEPEDAWASLCPETEKERDECLSELNVEQTESLDEIPDVQDDTGNDTGCLPLIEKSQTSRENMLPVMKSLNATQKAVFYTIHEWCLNCVDKRDIEPFHMFITGGAGTGKSHLIKAIFYEATRILSRTCKEPDNTSVLLTAFTGTAAFNIGGCTLHHAFKLTKGLPLPYVPLSEQVLSTLHAQFIDLRILIIDEISMVHKRLLYYIHERLVQIKRNKNAFGGVAVISVGDFFQLPPVKQSKSERLFNGASGNPFDIWNDLFKSVELKEVMRQGDDQPFADLLNSIRIRTKDETIPQEISRVLKSREIEGPDDALHVFATNDEVNTFNNRKLSNLEEEIVEVSSLDFKKDKTSGKLVRLSKPSAKMVESLPSNLLLAHNARVMLTRNIDVSDGLANGVMGTIERFEMGNDSVVKSIGVEFDHERVGRSNSKMVNGKRIVFIERTEETNSRSCIVRHQFPLKLSWACTTHKVQGMTVDRIVVNLDKSFSAGQGYVALSRVTSLSGLYIETHDFDRFIGNIYADRDVGEAMENMAKWEFDTLLTASASENDVILLNVRSLQKNFDHLKADTRLTSARAICLTETWLTEDKHFVVQSFDFFHRSREQCYDVEDDFIQLRSSKGGGVGIFVRESENAQMLIFPVSNMEGLVLRLADITLIVLYRPPSYPKHFFLEKLKLLMTSSIVKDEANVYIVGDFNENVANCMGQIEREMIKHGFSQRVFQPSTEGGTTIDHVYVRKTLGINCRSVPAYFSDHSAIIISKS